MRRQPSKFEKFINDHELSAIEVGALSRLVEACRQNGDFLQGDHATIFSLTNCRDDDERFAVLSMLNKFFEVRNGDYHPRSEVRQ
jgi:hypothetical protein